MKQIALNLFREAIAAVDPYESVNQALRDLDGEIGRYDRLFIMGIGKAAFPMGRSAGDFFRGRVAKGIILTKYGHGGDAPDFEVVEAGHPIPDENGVFGAKAIFSAASEAKEGDTVLFLLSGGASALLVFPPDGITLDELKVTNKLLIESGASIGEINTVRKHLSMITGGNLARAAHPARVFSLILSDVVGDDISTIASGPTAPDPTTFSNALGVIEKYNLARRFPPKALERLRRGAAGEFEETPKADDPVFLRTRNIIVGSAGMALGAAAKKGESLGFKPLVLSSSFVGDTSELARFHAEIAREVVTHGRPSSPPIAIVSGGESTVRIRGSGTGGRNTEFALAFSLAIAELEGVYGLFCGSDGTDGPTDAAGAFVDPHTVSRATRDGISPEDYLKDNDTYTFFKRIGDLVITGPTRTNVMDIRIVLIDEEKDA